MLSLMIVPYESTVVFIDQRMQEKLPSEDFSQCLLSYQEKQHSAVHFQMNRLQPRKSQLDTVYSWIGKKLTRLLMNVPPILEGMIAYVQKRSVFVRLWFMCPCVSCLARHALCDGLLVFVHLSLIFIFTGAATPSLTCVSPQHL